LISGVIDLIFAILFGLFLYSYARTKPTFEWSYTALNKKLCIGGLERRKC
jgi:hypothetical protein